MAAIAALCAGLGTWLLLSAAVNGRRDLRPAPLLRVRSSSRWNISRTEIASTVLAGSVGIAVGWLLFGAPLPALALGAFMASAPRQVDLRARAKRLEVARSHWPQLIEELRVLTGSLGHSIPHALMEVGRHAPTELRGAFAAAEREWLLTTDLTKALQTLKDELADPAADTICETLLVAHELGGSGLDQRLTALAEDRDRDLQHRRDAEARQAGARFARRFVLLVPAGMALAGMSVGTGRAAYRSPSAQLVVLVAIAMVVACWVWAGRIMALPTPQRVLDR